MDSSHIAADIRAQQGARLDNLENVVHELLDICRAMNERLAALESQAREQQKVQPT